MTINRANEKFYRIFDLLSKKEPDISIGKMMSSPGIKNPEYLSPFKSKPPMTGWICLSYSDEKKWDEFAEIALDVMRSEID